MRIVIDLQGAQTESRVRGIGRYSLSFAQAIARNRGEHEVIIALSGLFPNTIEPIRAAFEGLLPQVNIRVWHAPSGVRECEPSNVYRRDVAEIIREAFLVSLEPDIIHVSSPFEGYIDDAITSINRFDRSTPVSVSFYDLIPLLNPDHYLKPNPLYAEYYHRKIKYLKQASIYLAISESTRQEGLMHLGKSEKSIVNVTTAIDSCFRPLNIDGDAYSKLRQKFGLPHSFVLYTGGADDRKNLLRLIEAYSVLPARLRDGRQLVLAGQINIASFLKKQAESFGLKSTDLCFTGYVTDIELVQLYNLCELFVFPSWQEGFGLPALEAMACGAAVIGANTSSLPEVIGLNSALFDPFDAYAIMAKMAKALEDNEFRAELREHGKRQAAKFSWDEVARRSIDAFKQHVHQTLQLDTHKTDSEQIIQNLIIAVSQLATSKMLSDTDVLVISAAISQNHPESGRRRKLFVDISELVQRDARTGVQRVTRSILRELLISPPRNYEVHAVYATTNQAGYRLANNFTRNFLDASNGDLEDVFLEAQSGDIFLGLDLQHHTTKTQEGYLSKLRQGGTHVWFVIYDLLPVLFPHYWPNQHRFNEIHHEWLGVIAKFDGVLCISKSVANEFSNWLKENRPERYRPLQIEWFHLGADIETSANTQSIHEMENEFLCLLKARMSFLMVGTLEPRKGHAEVLEAFEVLWETGVEVSLVIVGKQGWLVEHFIDRLREHPELNKRLFWFNDVSDEYLENIYASSTCLIAASYGEGFGLPLIEAAQHSLPIIAREIPVFVEVAGEYAFYFRQNGYKDLVIALTAWLDLFRQGIHPRSENMPWLTWSQSAQMLWQMIEPNGASNKEVLQ